jgi:hypothetical protein
MTTVKDIVIEYLGAHPEYDGLCNDDDCGCMKDDLYPCCDNPPPDCVLGHNVGPKYNSKWYIEEGPKKLICEGVTDQCIEIDCAHAKPHVIKLLTCIAVACEKSQYENDPTIVQCLPVKKDGKP